MININHGNKEPICGYQNRNISQVLKFGGYVKVTNSM
jgi:hypothetical protein